MPGRTRTGGAARGRLSGGAEQLPGREVVQVVVDNIAAGGGGIHCATHDLPGTPDAG
ncbi:agmatine deiminase family protein [Kitasatospora sp. NPDC096147]|uniref:agmatine deiminase family protein n=1 Tax=Kitasatospora sp. NPDC096147 TaxID=3364093 RepID=UPI003802C24A